MVSGALLIGTIFAVNAQAFERPFPEGQAISCQSNYLRAYTEVNIARGALHHVVISADRTEAAVFVVDKVRKDVNIPSQEPIILQAVNKGNAMDFVPAGEIDYNSSETSLSFTNGTDIYGHVGGQLKLDGIYLSFTCAEALK
jgi:hypothetical protein